MNEYFNPPQMQPERKEIIATAANRADNVDIVIQSNYGVSVDFDVMMRDDEYKTPKGNGNNSKPRLVVTGGVMPNNFGNLFKVGDEVTRVGGKSVDKTPFSNDADALMQLIDALKDDNIESKHAPFIKNSQQKDIKTIAFAVRRLEPLPYKSLTSNNFTSPDEDEEGGAPRPPSRNLGADAATASAASGDDDDDEETEDEVEEGGAPSTTTRSEKTDAAGKATGKHPGFALSRCADKCNSILRIKGNDNEDDINQAAALESATARASAKPPEKNSHPPPDNETKMVLTKIKDKIISGDADTIKDQADGKEIYRSLSELDVDNATMVYQFVDKLSPNMIKILTGLDGLEETEVALEAQKKKYLEAVVAAAKVENESEVVGKLAENELNVKDLSKSRSHDLLDFLEIGQEAARRIIWAAAILHSLEVERTVVAPPSSPPRDGGGKKSRKRLRKKRRVTKKKRRRSRKTKKKQKKCRPKKRAYTRKR